MSAKRLGVILNGKAAGNEAVRAAVAEQRQAGASVAVRVTWEGGDAGRFIAELSGEADVLVAAGGDGTVNEIVHGLMELPAATRPALGIVPQGTANDFANACGIPVEPREALALCVAGVAVPVDVGRANHRWFLNAASSGFGATVTASTPPELKRLLGGAAYTLMGAILATNFKPSEGRLVLPDRELDGGGVVAIVGNGRQTGGGKQTTPKAFIDDGLLDLLVIDEIPLTELLTAGRELQELSPDGRFISYWQVPWAEFHAAQPFPINLDGEPAEFTRVRYEAVAGALQLIVPPDCPLLRRNAEVAPAGE